MRLKDYKRALAVRIQRLSDRLHGLDWDELEPHDEQCPYCGDWMYRFEHGPPWTLRCKNCGVVGTASRYGLSDKRLYGGSEP